MNQHIEGTIMISLAEGESLGRAARRLGIRLRVLQQLNPDVMPDDTPGVIHIYPPTRGCAEGAFVRSMPGETAAAFAGRFGMTLYRLCKYNLFLDLSEKLGGQVLVVPWDNWIGR